MTVNTIVFGLFLLLLAFVIYNGRKSYLDKVPYLPGESIVFEEKGVRVFQDDNCYDPCLIRLTTKRLIVAQKIALRNRFKIWFIFHIPSEGKTSIDGMYVTSHLQTKDVTLDKASSEIRLPLGNTFLTQSQRVRICTKHPDKYSRIFTDKS